MRSQREEGPLSSRISPILTTAVISNDNWNGFVSVNCCETATGNLLGPPRRCQLSLDTLNEERFLIAIQLVIVHAVPGSTELCNMEHFQ